jgi:surface antigen
MLKRKTLAVGLTALLASATAIQPLAAQQYQPYNDYNQNQYNQNQYGGDDYYRQQEEYNRQQSQYERDRQYYDQQRAGQTYQQPNQYGSPYAQQPYNNQYNNQYYTQNDDAYYRDCRQQRSGNTVAGLIIGGALGAALGSTIARGPARGGGTALGAILGGALGAGVGQNSLNCDDRNYLYTTSYSAFDRGIPRRTYDWRNPRTGNYGRVYVGDYYRGQYGYRCANYTQTIWVRGRPVPASGHACRQPDGNWVIVD